jgi:predicted RNase H-like HicB family nuclease
MKKFRKDKLSSMLTQYIQAAMRQANYKILADDEGFFGEIPGFQGVWANAETLEACRDELAEVLEEWIFFRLSDHLPLPTVNGLNLVVEKVS